jgi:hypothetical protein
LAGSRLTAIQCELPQLTGQTTSRHAASSTRLVQRATALCAEPTARAGGGDATAARPRPPMTAPALRPLAGDRAPEAAVVVMAMAAACALSSLVMKKVENTNTDDGDAADCVDGCADGGAAPCERSARRAS